MNLPGPRQILILEGNYGHIVLGSFQSHLRKGTISLGNNKMDSSEKLISIDFNIL